MGRYRGFAAPSPHPSPRRGEGDDVSLALSFQDRPGRFSPSPRRGEGARRAGEGAGPKMQTEERPIASLAAPLDTAFSSPQREGGAKLPHVLQSIADSDGASRPGDNEKTLTVPLSVSQSFPGNSSCTAHPHRSPASIFSARMAAGSLSWLGLSFADVLRWKAMAGPGAARPIRGVILAFCPGGPSHLETFDPKPDAPREIRGEFDSIATALPGRSLRSIPPGSGTQNGPGEPGSFDDDDQPGARVGRAPSFGRRHPAPLPEPAWPPRATTGRISVRLVAATRRPRRGIPSSVILPTHLTFEGTNFPGQSAGFL